jgi:hypothetical protein
MTNPTTPFSWQMPTASDLVTDLPADFETFGQAVATSMADLLGGTTGQVLSKASNTDMDFTWVAADDTNAIQNAIVDAKGDLIAASAADTPARLAVGANGSVLTPDSTAATGLKWARNPSVVGCAVYSTAQAIANNTDTNLNFDTERLDTDGFHSTVTNTSRITIPTGLTGWYVVNAKFRWDKNATGVRLLKIKKNGTEINAAPELSGSSTVFMGNELNIVDYFVAGDYIEFSVFQTSGGALNAYLDSINGQFSVIMVGV